jgi:hypothetical protein
VMSRRVHSRYQRTLADTASGGQQVLIRLGACRFFCSNGACAKATFAEQVPGLTTRYGRRTCGLQVVLQAVSLARGGRAGARLAGRLACSAGRSTLLRLIRAMPDPHSGTPLILGIDDFALRKGHIYGTILVDIETRRPVDMLPERSAESFRAWLDAQISCTLRLDPKTVRRYATAATAGELTGGARLSRPGLLGPHQAYLRQRWDEGVHSTSQLHAELRERGYRGSLRTLRRLTAQLRADTAVPTPLPAPKTKQVTSWLLTTPGKLTDRAALAQITARCEELTTTRDLVREFADMLCNQGGERLEAWATQAEASPVSELRGFAKGLRRDWAAVTNGLTTPYNSGPVEGHVNRKDDQKTDVRPGETRPAPKTRPARRLTPVTESGSEPSPDVP